ncbi:hypothetical protein SLE2022_149340 [Rubroshorea leprosula]
MMPGIYDGEGRVIQFTNKAGGGSGTPIDSVISSSPASSATGKPCDRCGYPSGLGGVVSSCIDCFVQDGDLCLFEYDVSTPYFLTRLRGGTCSTASSDSPKVVLCRARYLLENDFGDYSLFSINCEDFAIYCKTGQILKGPNRIGQTCLFSVLMAVPAFIIAPALVFASPLISMHLSRLNTENLRLKQRKIRVEELSQYLSS